MHRHPRQAFARIDLLVLVVSVIALTALGLPQLAQAHSISMIDGSISNLSTFALAHAMYAADWNGRQVTFVVDDISPYGPDIGQAFQNYQSATGEPHPPLLAGWCTSGLWGYWFEYAGGSFAEVTYPINFQNPFESFGTFRMPNAKAFHDYLGGRFYEADLYAPADAQVLAVVEDLFDSPCEYNQEGNPSLWSSYVFSPAAMFDPEVMRPEAEGGFQDPWELPDGLNSPPLTAALYPDLKTHMLEHHWLQNAPAPCNPLYEEGTYGGCEPYYFNHGLDSAPATLFYDGHVRLLPNEEVLIGDQTILKQTGGLDGLWHRGTPFGSNGYLIEYGYDGTPLSHHILTTGGILGRDTLGGLAISGAAMGTVRFQPSFLSGGASPPAPPLPFTVAPGGQP